MYVVAKLQGGADLMTPGLQRGPPFPKKAIKGAIVAIASLEAPTVPMAVGTCEIDVNALGETQGMKGHAVSTFHWAGDELWSWSSNSTPGSDPPDVIAGWGDEQAEEASLAKRTASVDLDDQEGRDTLATDPTERSDAEKAQGIDGEDAPSKNDFIDVVDEELTTKEIDEAFKNAFLYGVRHHMEHNKELPSYGLEFPLSQSSVMSLLVYPFLPTYSAARTASLHIKKTSWKNIRKFIRYLNKQLIVKCKDRGVDEVVITDIDFKDRQVAAFVPYRLPKKDAPTASASTNGKPVAPPTGESSVGQKLKLVSLLRPKDKLAPILQASKSDPRGLYTPAELRQLLITYVEAENLVNAKNRRLININPQIADALLGSSAADNAALSSGSMPRDALAERMVAQSSPFHAILRNDADMADTKPKAGAPPKIQIILETRSGNKTVSKVHGLEPYYISPQPLADELRKTCAGSTSVDKLQGSSPKAPVMEVMIQGPQKDAIIKALEKRGVNRNWVEVVDKTKGKKK
jgi:translation initiation factor 2D